MNNLLSTLKDGTDLEHAQTLEANKHPSKEHIYLLGLSQENSTESPDKSIASKLQAMTLIHKYDSTEQQINDAQQSVTQPNLKLSTDKKLQQQDLVGKETLVTEDISDDQKQRHPLVVVRGNQQTKQSAEA